MAEEEKQAEGKRKLPLLKVLVLVTGAARGIGRATAVAFARLGAELVIAVGGERRVLELPAG